MAKKVIKKIVKNKLKETEVDDREELDDSSIDFDVPENVAETKKVVKNKPVKKDDEQEDEETQDEEEQDEEQDEDQDNNVDDEEQEEPEIEKAFSPKKYKSNNEEVIPKQPKKMSLLPYLFMIFGLSSLAFFLMSLILVLIPYAFLPAAGYAIIIVMSVLLSGLSYWVITRGSDSSYGVAWGGLMVPLFPLAAIIFLQRVMLELALRRNEIIEAIGKPIPALFAPIFDSTYPLPIIIAIVFHAAYIIPFVIFLLRKKPFAALYFIAAPLFFVALWFLLSPLIDQMVFAWVAYFKSL